jgi:lipopolysaccharide transport system permease protein
MQQTAHKPIIYEAHSRRKMGFFAVWLLMAKNIGASRELIYQLFKRDFFAAYKKSFLGITWVFISPVIGIVSWVFMNAAGVLNPGSVGIPYPAYVLLSSSIWGLFMGFYGAGESTLGAGAGFIIQVKYPHEALLIKQTAQHLANFVIGFASNIIVLLAFGVIPHWKIVFFPLLILPLFFLGAGLGLVMSVVAVVAPEVKTVWNIFLGFLIYLTPVIYSPDFNNPILQKVIKWNPLTYLIGGVRDEIIYGRMNSPAGFALATGLALIVFMLSWRLFFISEDKVIEKMI